MDNLFFQINDRFFYFCREGFKAVHDKGYVIELFESHTKTNQGCIDTRDGSFQIVFGRQRNLPLILDLMR